MAKRRKGEGQAVFQYHLGRKFVATDVFGKPVFALIDGSPADHTRDDLLTSAERVELMRGVEADRRDFYHSKFLHLQENDPRFDAVRRKLARTLDQHDALLANEDPEVFSELYDQVRGSVGRSDSEREQIEARNQEAAEAQERYLAGKGGLDDVAILFDVRGAQKAIKVPEPEEEDEAAEVQRYYDELAVDAVRDRNAFRREALEARVKEKKGLTPEETQELLDLRQQVPAEGGDDD